MKIIKIENRFEDARGLIENITPKRVAIKDILYITGKKGAVRGNHYHKKDQHYCYVISGSILYQSRSVEGKEEEVLLKPGDLVVNDLLDRHRFVFQTDGAFIAMATQARDQDHYEEDTIRVDF